MNMRNYQLLLMLGMMLLGIPDMYSADVRPSAEVAMQESVSGTVKDAAGIPIIGASVFVKGTNKGTITDIDGNFTISVAPGTVLVFSSIGYNNVEVVASPDMNVILQEDQELLDEVVVVGYGTVKKKDLTGSVSSFRKKDMGQGVNASLSALMEGRAAGVRVTQSSAEPGGGIDVQIRGAGSVNASSAPLYVVDGLPIETNNVVSGQGASMPGVSAARNPISNINPADIESIEILKDASATAIYGARGANGVIIVTTKKGSSGRTKVSYDGYVAIQDPKKMVAVLNAEDYKRILNEIQATPGSGVSETEIVTDIENGGTDWQSLLIRKAALHSHSLSLTGGGKDIKYFASVNIFNQDGVLKESGYDRYDGRINLEYAGKRLRAGANMTTSYSKDKVVPLGYGTNEEGGLLYSARNYDPTQAVKNDDGTYKRSSFLNVENPLALLYGKTSMTNNYRTLGTYWADFTIMQGWTIKANIGFDVRLSRRDTYVSQLTQDGRANSGVANVFSGTRSNYLGELTTTYIKDFCTSNGSPANIRV